MFGFKKRTWTQQLQRAATIENCLKAGVFDRQVELHGYDANLNKPSDDELAMFAGAINHILGWSVEPQIQMLGGDFAAKEKISSYAHQILESDSDLEKLVVRLLYEIASLGQMLKREAWPKQYLQDHPRIMDILTQARPKYPTLFSDIHEREFKSLFESFIIRYLPDMKEKVAHLFR